MKKSFAIIFLNFVILNLIYSQSPITITIDDVPNTKIYKKNNYYAKLLHKLDSIDVPVTIFINEGLIYKNDSIDKNINLLNNCIKRDYVTIGNHSFSHYRYSKVNIDSFKNDIEKGEILTLKIAEKHQKSLKYFRFPYNDLGKDSLQQKNIESFLKSKKYEVCPFTIESSDWVYNYLYEYYLDNNKPKEAERIGKSYIEKTLQYFDFFDSVSVNQYGRHIHQIYLCHDNAINAEYIDVLISELKEQGYSLISLKDALKDHVYLQKNYYHKKWGVSWIYRLMKIHKERINLMKQEPEINKIFKEYNEKNSSN